ncbi:MAG TPA: M1 family aminopeptidase [Thermoanaerobaculia bacterium]|nr:M1 family aminopeptidase [Thermoanaerobaculia bacterium]
MRLWEIFRYDLATQLRRWPTVFYSIGLAGMALLVGSTFVDDAKRDGVLLNAPLVTAATLVITTLVGLLVTAALAGEAATRDIQARMEPLLYTTPVSKATYLGGRFLSAFAAGTVLLAFVLLVLAAARFIPGVDASFFGPFHLGPYLYAFAIVGLPNAFIATALLFSLVALTRRPMIGFAGAAALFINAIVQDEIVAGLFARWDLAKLLDPFAFILARAQWRSFTVAQRNTNWLLLEGEMLTNRLLWIGVSLVALTIVQLRFRMAHVGPRQRRGKAVAEAPMLAAAPPVLDIHFTALTRLWQTLAITLHSYREMITSRAAWLLALIGLLLFRITPELLEVGLGTPTIPNTGRIVMLSARFSTIGILVGALIVFFAGHLVWRERDARENDITDAAPVPDTVTFAGKFAALALMLVTLQAVVTAAGVATQIAAGYSDHEPLLYLRVLFGMKLLDYLLFAALAMAVHVVIRQKYLSTAVAMLAWLFPGYADDFGVEHNMLKYASDPGFTYSDFNGFGAALGPWLWFKLYWLGWALLFALIARLYWVRGHERRRQRFTRGTMLTAAVALALLFGAGGFVFYNTNVLNEFVSDATAVERSVEYERKYKQYAKLAQPLLTGTKLQIELHPAQNSADIRGSYRLENHSGRPVDAIHLVAQRSLDSVSFDRPSRPALIDRELGYRIYKLDQPLTPGDSLRLDFTVRIAPRGFTNYGISSAIASNGTLLENRPGRGAGTWLPAVGYRSDPELYDAYERRQRGLPVRAPRLPSDPAVRNDRAGLELIDLETVIGTDADQIAVAPGALRRSWTQNGRRYFHYVTDAPIRNGIPILSARYAVRKARWKDVDIEVLHHPKHAWNAERFARSAQASLECYSREFGPYAHKQLRIVEFPSTGGYRMTGHPGTVIWTESFGLAQPERDHRQVDFPFAVLAHEVAHQWWGNQLILARAEGAAFVSESLAWYSAMMVVNESRGAEHLARFMSVLRMVYLTPNATSEVPLLRADDWIDVYRTGALAMSTLRETIGEKRVNAALRKLLADFDGAAPPFATSLDLYARLKASAPPSTHALLKDLFEEITFWDLRANAVRGERIAGGAHRVTVDVEAYKIKADGDGRERRVPMENDVVIAVYDAEDKPLYRQRHRVRNGMQSITVTVPGAPVSAGVDPDSELMDRIRTDNFVNVPPPPA